jgi:hypothetical protein
MSLKNFHLLFVATAVLMALFCAMQAFAAYRSEGQPAMATLAAGALAATVLLVRFEVRFLRRCRREGVR